MTHLLVIGLVLVGAVRDLVPEGAVPTPTPRGLAFGLAPFVVLALAQWAFAVRCVRQMDRGDPRGVDRFGRLSGAVRVFTLPVHAVAVLGFGWLDAVRGGVGQLVGVDEVLALLPPFALLAASWAAAAPVERRVREALLIRRLDLGLHVPAMPSMGRWWWGQVRQQLLFAAAPVLLIMTWAECVALVRDGLWARMNFEEFGRPVAPVWTSGAPAWILEPDVIVYGSAVAQLMGVVVLLALLPVALRLLWDTVPLGPGVVRDALLGACKKHRVRVRDILVWRTHGAMINGAVVGFLPRLRYIVLTDALLESLSVEQVESVTAHEIAHAKHRHIPWLGAALAGSSVFFGALGSLVTRASGGGQVTEGWGPVVLLICVLGASVMVFGWLSRRFEWQADVFAAQHMTRRASGSEAVRIEPEGAGVMSETLRAVALVNGFPPGRFTFRHGSIDGRRRRLAQAVGQPLHGADADRVCRRAKLVIAGAILVGIAMGAAEMVFFGA